MIAFLNLFIEKKSPEVFGSHDLTTPLVKFSSNKVDMTAMKSAHIHFRYNAPRVQQHIQTKLFMSSFWLSIVSEPRRIECR